MKPTLAQASIAALKERLQETEEQRKKIRSTYYKVGIINLLILLISSVGLIATALSQHFFLTLAVLGFAVVTFLIINQINQQQFKAHHQLFIRKYFPCIIEQLYPEFMYFGDQQLNLDNAFELEGIRGLSIEKNEHFIKGHLKGKEMFICALNIKEQKKGNLQQKIRFNGIFMEISSFNIEQLNAIKLAGFWQQAANYWGYDPSFQLSKNGNLRVYFYTDKAFMEFSANSEIFNYDFLEKHLLDLENSLQLFYHIADFLDLEINP